MKRSSQFLTLSSKSFKPFELTKEIKKLVYRKMERKYTDFYATSVLVNVRLKNICLLGGSNDAVENFLLAN